MHLKASIKHLFLLLTEALFQLLHPVIDLAVLLGELVKPGHYLLQLLLVGLGQPLTSV